MEIYGKTPCITGMPDIVNRLEFRLEKPRILDISACNHDARFNFPGLLKTVHLPRLRIAEVKQFISLNAVVIALNKTMGSTNYVIHRRVVILL